YNAQTSVNEQQVILAAEITIDAGDFGHLEPMLDTTLTQLERHGVSEQPEVVLADAGYWHTRQIQSIAQRGWKCSSRLTERCATGSVPAGSTASSTSCARSY